MSRDGARRERRCRAKASVIFRWIVLLGVSIAVAAAFAGDVLSVPTGIACDPEPPLPGVPKPPEFRYDGAYPIPILMYHQIDAPAKGLTVTPHDFASQIEVLASAGYTTVSMDAVLLAMAGEPVPLPPKAIVLTFDDGYRCFVRNAHPILRDRGFTATLFLISGMIGDPGYLTWEEVGGLVREGYTVGCHTKSHPDLRILSGARLEREVSGAREVLRERTGQAVFSFCYPSGWYDTEVVDAVKSAGFMGAVTTQGGIAELSSEPYTLKRIRVDGRESLEVFKRKLGIQ